MHRKIAVTFAAVLLLGSTSAGFAQGTGRGGARTPGAGIGGARTPGIGTGSDRRGTPARQRRRRRRRDARRRNRRIDEFFRHSPWHAVWQSVWQSVRRQSVRDRSPRCAYAWSDSGCGYQGRILGSHSLQAVPSQREISQWTPSLPRLAGLSLFSLLPFKRIIALPAKLPKLVRRPRPNSPHHQVTCILRARQNEPRPRCHAPGGWWVRQPGVICARNP